MNRQLSINPYIFGYVSKDYANGLPRGEVRLDCSLGVSPRPLQASVFTKLRELPLGSSSDAIKYYPHSEALKRTLADWYRRNGVGESWMTEKNFLLGNGSYDILCSLNLLCLSKGDRVLGHAPQFTAYVDHVNCIGAEYDAYYLRRENGYLFEADAYLEKMSRAHRLFIVENPNNPTGQVIALEDLEKIAKKAAQLGRLLVVDEAYGEYLPARSSAMNLIPGYPNVVVTRTFSKGFGMAGLRLGYAVGNRGEDGVLPQLQKLLLPFNSNSIARILAQATLESLMEEGKGLWAALDSESLTAQKQVLLRAIQRLNGEYGRSLRVAATAEHTPIMTLFYDEGGEGFHLQSHLMRYGLLTVSCEGYLGLGPGVVRLMLPHPTQSALLVRLLGDAIRELPVLL